MPEACTKLNEASLMYLGMFLYSMDCPWHHKGIDRESCCGISGFRRFKSLKSLQTVETGGRGGGWSYLAPTKDLSLDTSKP